MQDKVDEKELLLLVSQGDRAAFSQLYARYLNNIYRYIFSLCFDKSTSEEVAQDLFIKIWENRLRLVNITSFKPYLYRSAKNLLLNHIRKEQLQAKVITSYHGQFPVSDGRMDEKIEYDQYCQIARNAVELLPEKRKQIFRLRSDEALTIDEIAARLSISRSVVKKQWHKGVLFVREYLYKHGEITVLIFSLLILK